MLSSVISGIQLLQDLYNIYEELKENAENCKIMFEDENIREAVAGFA
jgi:hypothetical protein